RLHQLQFLTSRRGSSNAAITVVSTIVSGGSSGLGEGNRPVVLRVRASVHSSSRGRRRAHHRRRRQRRQRRRQRQEAQQPFVATTRRRRGKERGGELRGAAGLEARALRGLLHPCSKSTHRRRRCRRCGGIIVSSGERKTSRRSVAAGFRPWHR
ncbi:unnamed protein product, partial [Ectocarpus sp. 12 AP-2014]